eukprot:s4216_g3.t1
MNLQEQSRFMRRFIAGAYGVNAVYFFRNQRFINTIYLNPVDLICACRYDHRRLAVIHMCMQNGMQVPSAHQQRLFDAIDEWNREKSRETQRPQWATHSSPAHILAIVDTPVPNEFRRDTTGTTTAEADTTDTAAASSSTTRVTYSSVRPPMPPPPSRVLGAEAKAKAKAAPAKGGKKGEKGEGKPTRYHAERQENAPWQRDARSWGSGSDRNDWSADQDDVRDHVKGTWENDKEEEDLDEEIFFDDEVAEEAEEHGGDEDEKMEGSNVNPGESNAKFKETEKDDVDDFLRQEQKEERKAASEEAKGATSGVRDARDYPAWMRRIKFGSQVLPQEPCLVGDAQTELIHIVILMIARSSAMIGECNQCSQSRTGLTLSPPERNLSRLICGH